jgi:hypothetical protein
MYSNLKRKYYYFFKTSEIVTKFNVYNYGGLTLNSLEFDLESAYKASTSNTLFLVTMDKNGKYKN